LAKSDFLGAFTNHTFKIFIAIFGITGGKYNSAQVFQVMDVSVKCTQACALLSLLQTLNSHSSRVIVGVDLGNGNLSPGY
jgi:hypothetical protein